MWRLRHGPPTKMAKNDFQICVPYSTTYEGVNAVLGPLEID